MSAAALYLHLCALGVRMSVVQQPDHPDGGGYGFKVAGQKALPEPKQRRTRRLIKAHKPALIALLRSGAPDALAVRQEGSDGSYRRTREEAV